MKLRAGESWQRLTRLNNSFWQFAYRKADPADADTNSVAHAWSKVFKCDPNDTITIYLKLADLLELSRDIEEAVTSVYGIRHSKYLSSFKKMRIGLTPRSMDSSKNSDTFDAEMESRLEFRPPIDEGKTVLEEPRLDDVRANVEKLFKDIEKAKHLAIAEEGPSSTCRTTATVNCGL